MAFELSKDLTFFAEVTNNFNMQEDDSLIAKKLRDKPKTPQKPKSPNTNKRKTCNSSQKENTAPEKAKAKKTSQETRKSTRAPLMAISATVEASQKNKKAPKRRSAPERDLSLSQAKAGKKEKINLPEIIVYEDSPTKNKVQEKGNKNKSVRGLSKSWDGSVAVNRKSHPESNKSPRQMSAKTKNVRYSLNDLSSAKSPTKNGKSSKSSTESEKSPAKGKPMTKLRPGQPEFEEMLAKLENLFPNVDPEFMKAQFIKSKGCVSELIEVIITKEKTDELPTRVDYVKRLEMEKLQNKFMENFSVENFLKMISDPWEHFLKTEKPNCAKYLGHSLHYLKNKYKKCYLRDIQEALVRNDYSLYLADKELKKRSRSPKIRITNRSKQECNAGRPTNFNIQFIQEVAFIENEGKIKSYIKKAETARHKKFMEAKEAGSLLECQSCNDFSLLQDDAVNCPANHVFCKDCVTKYVQIETGKNSFQFKCLLKCEEKFSLETLQTILSPIVMAKIIQRNQVEEVKSAGVNDLVSCPFCYYVAIMPPELSVFKCLNTVCMIESCRYCRKLSHIPLKCNELEKFDKTNLEVEIEKEEQEEEKMNEKKNLDLKCTECNGEFLKREDSKQMVCPCGATICSICRQPFRECKHFSDEPRNETMHRLSSSDEDDIESEETVAEDDIEKPSEFSENLLQMFLSDSENF